MKILVTGIPPAALFYNNTREGLFEVFLEFFENGCVKDPVNCRPQDSEDKLEDIGKYYGTLLPYVDDIVVKRLLIESMIIDAKIDIQLYIDAINNSTPEELGKKWGDPDPTNWLTLLYPTRLKLYQDNMRNVEEELRKYEAMLLELDQL